MCIFAFSCVFFFLDMFVVCLLFVFFLFNQTTAYGMRISDWSSDVCSSDRAPDRIAVVEAADYGGNHRHHRQAGIGADGLVQCRREHLLGGLDVGQVDGNKDAAGHWSGLLGAISDALYACTAIHAREPL